MPSKPHAKDGSVPEFSTSQRRLRLLPIMMVAAAALLGIKVNGIAVSAYAMLADEKVAQDLAAIAPSAAQPQASAQPQAKEKGQAQANGSQPEAATTGKAPESVASTASPASETVPEPGEEGDFLSRSEINLLQDLSERRRKLDERSTELDTRERLLMAAEQRIDRKIERLKSLEGSIKDLVRIHNEKEEAQLQGLVKIYETMKPKEAALILEKLDMPILLSVVERMKTQKVAGVLAAMDTKVAKQITTELASRQTLPPEQEGES